MDNTLKFHCTPYSLIILQSVSETVLTTGRHRLRSNTGSLHRMPSRAKKSFTGRIKSSLPVGYSKTKPLMKRVKVLLQEMDGLSERNAKHLFIEHCQVTKTCYLIRGCWINIEC